MRRKIAFAAILAFGRCFSQTSSPGQDDREQIRSQIMTSFSSIHTEGATVPLLSNVDITLGATTPAGKGATLDPVTKIAATVAAKCNYDYTFDRAEKGAFRCHKGSSIRIKVEVIISHHGARWELQDLSFSDSSMLGGVVDSLTPSVTLPRPSSPERPPTKEQVLNIGKSAVGSYSPGATQKIVAVVVGTWAALAIIDVPGKRYFALSGPYGGSAYECGSSSDSTSFGIGEKKIPLGCPGTTQVFIPPDFNFAEVVTLTGTRSAAVQTKGSQRVYSVRPGDQAIVLVKK